MDAATRARVMAEYEPGNRRLAERRFGRPRLFAEPLPPADAAVADQRLPADSYDTIARFVAPMLRGLVLEQLEALRTAREGEGNSDGAPAAVQEMERRSV